MSYYRVKIFCRTPENGEKDLYDGWWNVEAEISKGEKILEHIKTITPPNAEIDVHTLIEIPQEEFEKGMAVKRKQCEGYPLKYYYTEVI